MSRIKMGTRVKVRSNLNPEFFYHMALSFENKLFYFGTIYKISPELELKGEFKVGEVRSLPKKKSERAWKVTILK